MAEAPDSNVTTLSNNVTDYVYQGISEYEQLEVYVIITAILYSTLFFVGYIKCRVAGQWLRPLSKGLYMLILVLIPYILGLMGNSDGWFFTELYSVWAVFLLFAYSGLDNLTAINLEMRNYRPSLLFRFSMQIAMLILFLYTFAYPSTMVSVGVVFFIVCIKMVERTGALAHAAGVTSGLRENIRRVVRYMNVGKDDPAVDPLTMKGFKYLVGPRCSTVDKRNKITDGVSVENIWGCQGRLLSSGDPDGQLKDTCLSFAFFWLLLAKFWGYPLYHGGSKIKAWKLVHDGLLAGGDYKRIFRVIEVELCFFHDFFYSKYFFFYLNGFYWKTITLFFPVVYWWTTMHYFNYKEYKGLFLAYFNIDFNVTPRTTTIVTTVILVLEAIQLGMFMTSVWLRVALLSYYAKREKMSERRWAFPSWCINWIIGAVCRISLSTNTSILYKPWKRELDQYSLLKSCTSFGIQKKNCLQVLMSGVGISILPPPGRKMDKSVPLSNEVKKAVAESLYMMNDLKLTNGSSSLRRNEVDKGLMWACDLNRDCEVILVWHIATSLCEMHSDSQDSIKSPDDFKVATTLSKYCAYLLAFAPSLVSVPLLEAEFMCDQAVTEARSLSKKLPFCVCGSAEEITLSNVKEMLAKKEVKEDDDDELLQKGMMLYDHLHQPAICGDEGERWKILAEFWAEMVLFLAQPNHNETFHAEKLTEGGEFITHLWALLVHAGIEERYG